jgi:hypothetical protein
MDNFPLEATSTLYFLIFCINITNIAAVEIFKVGVLLALLKISY